LAKKGLLRKILGFKKTSKKINLNEVLERVEKNPKDIKSIIKLGDYYLGRKKKAKAVEYYTTAATCCVEDGFVNKGIAISKKICAIEPENAENILQLANLYMRQNLFGEAILQFQRALEIDPENSQAQETLEKLSGTSQEQKNIIEALKADREVQITSRTTTQEDVFREAKEQIRKQITNEDSLEHYDLGIAYMEMELYESAIEEFGITLNKPDFFEDSIRLIYESFFALDNMQEAIAYLESLLKLSNLSPVQKGTIRFYIGMAYEDSLNSQKAMEIYEELLNTGYPKTDILTQRLDRLKKSGELDGVS